MSILKYYEFINESNKEEYIKKYCKETPPVPQISLDFKDLYGYLKSLGKYAETIKSIDKGGKQ